MSMAFLCDGCQRAEALREDDQPPVGWFIVKQVTLFYDEKVTNHFCSWACIRRYLKGFPEEEAKE